MADGVGVRSSGESRRPAAIDCRDAVHQLYDFLDGELTDQRRAQIALHLDRCGPCAKAAEFEGELRAVIASRCRDRVPDSLIERVARALDQERLRPPDAC